jgi:hypothetical protein
MVWFGTLFPRTGPDAAAFGERETHAVELARRDFTQIMSGASAPGTLERARPFDLVACDDAADPRRAANHLMDVGVPAVIGLFTRSPARASRPRPISRRSSPVTPTRSRRPSRPPPNLLSSSCLPSGAIT